MYLSDMGICLFFFFHNVCVASQPLRKCEENCSQVFLVQAELCLNKPLPEIGKHYVLLGSYALFN